MFALLPLSLVLAAPVPKDVRPLVNADPPKEWKLTEAFNAILRTEDPGPVRVLAWEVIDTKRGYALEKALVLKELDGGKCFLLMHLYRRPKAENPAWQSATVSSTEVKPNGVPIIVSKAGFLIATKPPTNGEIAELLDDTQWGELLKPHNDRTPELKAGGAVYANWKAALNRDPPTDLFPELKAK